MIFPDKFKFSLKTQQMEYSNINEKNKKLQKKLEEILPENLKDFVGDESEFLYIKIIECD